MGRRRQGGARRLDSSPGQAGQPAPLTRCEPPESTPGDSRPGREDDALHLYGRLVDFFERWIPPGPRDAPTPKADAGTR